MKSTHNFIDRNANMVDSKAGHPDMNMVDWTTIQQNFQQNLQKTTTFTQPLLKELEINIHNGIVTVVCKNQELEINTWYRIILSKQSKKLQLLMALLRQKQHYVFGDFITTKGFKPTQVWRDDVTWITTTGLTQPSISTKPHPFPLNLVQKSMLTTLTTGISNQTSGT